MPRAGRYAVAVFATLLVFLLQAAVFTPPIAPFVFFYVAVVASALFGGRGPSLVAVALSAASANYGFMEPQGGFALSASALTATMLFLVAATVVALLCASFREAIFRAGHDAEALRASEARFRQLANAVPQLVWTADPDGTVDYYNERVSEFAGFERTAEGAWSWRTVLHPDDVQVTTEAWSNAVAAGTVYEVAHRVLRADGAFRWYLSRALPVRDASGHIIKWFGTATDIDAQKQAEDVLKEVDRRKSEFLAVLSHELRNPLTPIRNSAYLLGQVEPSAPQAERARQVLERQVRHLTRLIDDLLDVQRIATGKFRMRSERLRLDELVRRTAEDHRSLFESRGIRFDANVDPSPICIMGDATRVAQVIGNLLSNAAKFTSHGDRVVLTLESEPESAVMRVRDDGAGIRPDLLERLFQPFAQAGQTIERSRGGLGLGLALVKGIVERLGGSVNATSAGEGKGAEFVVRLPRHRGEEQVERPSRPRMASGRLRVLVIEDNFDTAYSIKDVLEHLGHEVTVASTGLEGLKAAHAIQPQAAICDIGLPGIDGYEVARRMRADPELSKVRLIALSGYASPEDVERSRTAGFRLHLAKPPEPEALEAALLDAVDR